MRLLPVAAFAAALAALSGTPAADGRAAGVPSFFARVSAIAMLAPAGAVPACGPSIQHVSLRTPPEFCPRPLALTQRLARGHRLLRT